MENIVRIPTENLDYFIQAVLDYNSKASGRLLYHEGEESVFALTTESVQDLFNVAAKYGQHSILLYAIDRGLVKEKDIKNSRQGI